ncbi:MAG: glycine/sarcosine/betaine reductase selenoprotein B family protein [Phototrophicaceae bacterium]
MDILENREAWQAHFEANWLAHYEKTGETNFKLYEYSRNEDAPSGKAIDLSQSKLLFVTSSGAYLKASQTAFDAANPLGDYSVRLIPQSSRLDDLAFAHEHYDHQYVDQDPQSLVPLRILESLQADGVIGELAENIVSFHGYTPNVSIILDELIPQIIGLAKDQQVDAALLVPA